MTKKIPLLPKIVLLYLVLAVSIAGLRPLLTVPDVQLSQSPLLTVAVKKDVDVPLVYGQPVRLQVPRLGIDLRVKDGRYDKKTNKWQLSGNSVHYALTSHLPNNKYGNTVIYGHNHPKILGKTKELALYDELIVTTSNGRLFKYVYMDRSVVNPTNTQVFSDETSGPRVTLLTCQGAWDQERRLMVFEFSEID